MKLLAVDSSGRAAGVAVLQDGRLIYETYLDLGLTHSEVLLPLVQQALEQTGLTLAELDLLAVGAGPGSFTGLRIGMALIKGLALPLGLPCAGVSSLEALAYSLFLPPGCAVIAAQDARRGEAYYAAFARRGEGLARLCPDTAGPPGPLARLLAGWAGPVYLVGDGAQLCYNSLKGQLALQQVAPPWLLGRAVGVALAGQAQWQAGGALPAAELRPAYHRLSQAQREREQRLKESGQA